MGGTVSPTKWYHMLPQLEMRSGMCAGPFQPASTQKQSKGILFATDQSMILRIIAGVLLPPPAVMGRMGLMRRPCASRGHFSSSMKRWMSVCIACGVTSAARVNTSTDGCRIVSPGNRRKCVFTIPAESENVPFVNEASARHAPLQPTAISSPSPSGKSTPIHGIHWAEERPSVATSEQAPPAPPNVKVTGSKSFSVQTVPRSARRTAPFAGRVIVNDRNPSTISVGASPAHTSSGRYSCTGNFLYAFSVERSTSFPSGLLHSRTNFVKRLVSCTKVKPALDERTGHIAGFPA